VASEYDVIVIGAGTGGYPAAIRAAQLGLRVAVVERQKSLGGTCLIWGCIPTKALIEHAHALKIARGAKEWGLTIDGATVGIDMGQVQARKDRIVTGLTKGVEFLFRKNKIDWIKGTARLAGGGNVEVTGDQPQMLHAAKEIVVATGSQPRGVRGVEIDRKRIITSDEAIGFTEVPQSIAILGAGAIGVEFGCLLRRFGSEVTIIEILPRVVPLEDEAVSAELQKALRKQGIHVLTGTKLTSAGAGPDGVNIEAERPDGQAESIRAGYLLVATGRGPVTDGLGAAEAGLQLEHGYIRVDEFFRTSVPGISAIGDVITLGTPGHPQLAHVSTAEGIAVAERIAGQELRAINYDRVPSCTYSDPEIGSVGLTEQEAKDRGYDVNVGMFPFSAVGRAKIAAEIEGFVKIVAEKKYDEVLGVHIIGPRATELIAEATIALGLECTVEELTRTIHAHPTLAEAVGEAAHAVHGAAINI
jgi:dihydrolipoamide dehydrogenase